MGAKPSRYDPAYCEAIKMHCSVGGTILSFGGTVGVSRRTVYHWRDAHPDFDEACDIAKQLALYETEKKHWELAADGANTRGLEYRMQNLADERDQWRRVETKELSGPNGAPIPVEAIERRIVDPAN